MATAKAKQSRTTSARAAKSPRAARDRVTAYAEAVSKGKIIAGPHVMRVPGTCGICRKAKRAASSGMLPKRIEPSDFLPTSSA